jgi:hypothetical protein
MRRKTAATDQRPIPAAHSRRTHQQKFRALLQAGYAELGPEARRLEREFAHLEADPVLKALWENERDAAYDRP